MYSYTLYGLTVSTEIELPGLPPGRGSCDVRVVRTKLGSVERASPTNDGPPASYRISDGGKSVGGWIYDELKFFVIDGREIHIDLQKEISPEVLRGYLTGVLLATLLRQRGYVVLHASCVERAGAAIGFIGDSGWGKSTVAEYFCREGYSLLNDDILVVALNQEGPPVVVPGFPQVKLLPDTGARLRDDFHELPRMHERTAKRLNLSPEWKGERAHLSRLFVLESTFREENRIRSISAREALMELIKHSRASNLIAHPQVRAENLSRCADLVQRVPVAVLERRRGVEFLREIRQLVEPEPIVLSSLSPRWQG